MQHLTRSGNTVPTVAAWNEAYRWLSEKMGTPIEFTHIGMFDVDQCRKVVRIMQEERKQVWKI